MKYHQTSHKKTKDKKSYVTMIREEEQKKTDMLKMTDDKKNKNDSEKVADNIYLNVLCHTTLRHLEVCWNLLIYPEKRIKI